MELYSSKEEETGLRTSVSGKGSRIASERNLPDELIGETKICERRRIGARRVEDEHT